MVATSHLNDLKIQLVWARISSFSYDRSYFEDWVKRIDEGEGKRKAYIENAYKEIERSLVSNEEKEYFADFYSEENSDTEDITNYMYGALIVFIWARMEYCLNRILEYGDLKGKCKFLNRFTYNDFKKEFNKIRGRASDNLSDITGEDYVDAIRLLNNCFKHNDGIYKITKTSPITNLMLKWGIKDKEKISYSTLPVSDIITLLNEFCVNIRQILLNNT